MAIDHRLEIPAKMRPAILVLLDPVVTGEPVADDDLLAVGPEDRAGHIGTAVVGDREGGQVVGQADPEPRLLVGLGPRRLVDVGRRGGDDRGSHLGDDRLEDLSGLALQLGDHPQRDIQPEQVGGQLQDRPLGESVRAGEHGQDRPQARAERPGRNTRGEFRPSRGPAAGASQPVEAVFIDVGTDRRDLGDLVSHRIGIFSLERGATALAVLQLDLEGLSELLGRNERSVVAIVAGLTAPLPPRRR
jgi:hypothetical protein